MSSTVELVIVSEMGEHLSTSRFTVEYGNEKQRVFVILSDPDDPVVYMPFRAALDECMADQLANIEGFDA